MGGTDTWEACIVQDKRGLTGDLLLRRPTETQDQALGTVNLDRNRIPTPARQLPTLAQTLPTIDILDTQHFESLPESQPDASHDSEPLELPAGSLTLPPQTLLYDSQPLMADHIKDALFALADTQPDECIAEICTRTAQPNSEIVESFNAAQTHSEHGVGSMGSLPMFEAGMFRSASATGTQLPVGKPAFVDPYG